MDEDKPESKVKDVIDAATGLVKAVPIYQDAIQPAAKQVGKTLETVAKAINVALFPIGALVWGYDQLREFISTRVADKLKNIPIDRICTPSPSVAGPALEALRFTGHEEVLREMYANLLATSLDSETSSSAHPAFVEVIKQLSPLEAKIVKCLSERDEYPEVVQYCDTRSLRGSTGIFSFIMSGRYEKHSDIKVSLREICINAAVPDSCYVDTCLDNLLRLKILEIIEDYEIKKKSHLGFLFEEEDSDSQIDIQQEYIETLKFTSFGINFINACVKDKT